MLTPRLQQFFAQHHVPYDCIQHPPAFTAQKVAQSAHMSGRKIAKAVIVKADERFVMVVEPAHKKVDLTALEHWLGARSVRLAQEHEISPLFPECETGAIPIFGNLYHLEVFVDDSWSNRGGTIAFSAGNHGELVQMSYDDFVRLARPTPLHLH